MAGSVDINQILLQINSVERVQQVQQQHPDAQQRYFEIELNKEKKQLKEKVKNAQEAEQLRIKEKEERRKREKKARGNRATKEEDISGDPDDETAGCELGGKVDIKA